MTGYKLYDKVGEKLRKYKEQPEDLLWIPRVSKTNLDIKASKVVKYEKISVAQQKRFSNPAEVEKQRDAITGLRLYDKVGETSKMFREQPEDLLWILRLTQEELKAEGYPLYDKPGKQARRFRNQPEDLSWIPRK